MKCQCVVIATGGKSYPATGSTGEGYTLAQQCGHEVSALKPTLVGLETEPVFSDAAGLLVKNSNLSVFINKKKVYSEFG